MHRIKFLVFALFLASCERNPIVTKTVLYEWAKTRNFKVEDETVQCHLDVCQAIICYKGDMASCQLTKLQCHEPNICYLTR